MSAGPRSPSFDSATSSMFRTARANPSKALVCIVETNGGRLALLVDEVLGQLQVVVKSLEVNFRKVDALDEGDGFLGDGRVALIVDVQALSRTSTSAQFERNARPTAQALGDQ